MRRARRWVEALALGVALLFALTPASASDARSSPEDRQRFVAITRGMEQDPLKPGIRDDREWGLEWLTKAPDVTVTICADSLGGLLDSDYKYRGEILMQDMFSMAAFAIEHPDQANDEAAKQLAGLEGALKAYRSILRDKSEAKSTALEGFVQAQSRGELPDYFRKVAIRCFSKK
jgi:hypothetical protein